MKTEKNFIDYGIYVDRKVAYIVSLNSVVHEEFISEETEEFVSSEIGHRTHVQNNENEHLKKYCKSIIGKLDKAHSILIFGPSETKFELQKALRDDNSLKHINEELLVTDVMDKDAALRYVEKHFNS